MVEKKRPENISRYAAVPDYHEVVGEILKRACKALKEEFKDNAFEMFCDNSPIPEVYAASVSGLGLSGDNGTLISRNYGSYVFLGEIVTDLKLPCYNEYFECVHCGRCKAACPENLIKENCLSALSQKKGDLTDNDAEKLFKNGIIWGCDKCMDVCPFNKYARLTYLEKFILGYRKNYLPGEDTAHRPYMWRGENVIKRNFLINTQNLKLNIE